MKRPVRSCLWNAHISSSAVSRKTLALLEPETAGLSPRVHLRALARRVTFRKLSLSLFMTRTGFKLPSYCHLLFLPTPRKPPASTAMLSTPLGPQCMQFPPPHCRKNYIVLAQNLGDSFALKFQSSFKDLRRPPSWFPKLSVFVCLR